jgi:hypothetical protein
MLGAECVLGFFHRESWSGETVEMRLERTKGVKLAFRSNRMVAAMNGLRFVAGLRLS